VQGDAVSGTLLYEDAVAGPYRTRFDDSQVRAQSSAEEKAFGELSVVHAQAKLDARNPRLCHFQHRGSDLPPLTNYGSAKVESISRQVFTEPTGLHHQALGRVPVGVVLTGVRVNRLVRATVRTAVRLIVTNHVHAVDADGSPADRRFPNRSSN
jgi:hypothetical protein